MMKREPANVVCSSPDSTVQTEEIPDDLTFFDYNDFSVEFAALVGSCEGENNNIARVDHSTGAINVAPPNMLDIFITPESGDLVSLQPLQTSPAVVQTSDQNGGDTLWAAAHHPSWNGTSAVLAKTSDSLASSTWSNGNHTINGNGLKCKQEVSNGPTKTSHLRELLLQGNNTAYQKKSTEALVTLLKQQPYNNSSKEDSNGYDVSSPMYTVSITQVPSNGRDSVPLTEAQSYQVQKDSNGGSVMYDNVSSVTSCTAISSVSTTVNGHVMYNVPSHMTNGGSEMVNGSMLPINSIKQSSMIPNSGNFISQDYSKNNSPPNGICSKVSPGSMKHKPRTRTPTANMKKEGSRLHPCPICSKSFKDRFSLDAHYRIHTGERPFKCDVCNKGFKQKAHMQKHQSMHSGTPRDRMQQLQLNRDRANKKEYNRERKKKDKIMKKSISADKEDMKYNNGFGPSVYPDSFSDSSVSTTSGVLKDHIDITQIKTEVDEGGELYHRMTPIPPMHQPTMHTSLYQDADMGQAFVVEVQVNEGVGISFIAKHKGGPFQCSICRKTYNYVDLEEHAREHTQQASVGLNSVKLEDSLLVDIPCVYCEGSIEGQDMDFGARNCTCAQKSVMDI